MLKLRTAKPYLLSGTFITLSTSQLIGDAVGLFDRAKDSRIQQIISKQLGNNFSIATSGTGSFFCSGLTLSIKPFYAAIGDEGIAFINRAEVVLVLRWPDIHRCVMKSLERGVEVTFWAPVEDTLNIYSKEQPFNYLHDATIHFNDALVADKFFEIFKRYKTNNGFSEKSISLHNTWAQWKINEPTTLEKFHEANKDWATKEIRESSYEVWGDFLDSERFMYFVGRNVCSGLIPSSLLSTAFGDYKRLNKENSKYTLKSKLPDEESQNVIDETTNLSMYKETQSRAEWFLVKVDVQYQEWVGNMPMKQRRAAAKIYVGENDWTLLELHNDFHSGTSFPAFLNEMKGGKRIEFGGNFVTFREEDISRLTKIMKK